MRPTLCARLAQLLLAAALAVSLIAVPLPAQHASAWADEPAPRSIQSPAATSSANPESTTVRVGYYQGDYRFMDGFADDKRKTGYAYEYLQALAAIAGWDIEYVYGTREEMVELMERGDIDLLPGVHRTALRQEQMLFPEEDMGLEGDPRFLAVSKSRPEVLDQLEDALARLDASEPDFVQYLTNKHYPAPTLEEQLSDRERAMLAERGSLRMGFVRGSLPVSGEGENGEPAGIAAVLHDAVSSYLSVPIETRCYDNVESMLDALRAGEVDMAFPIYADLWVSEQNDVLQTNAVLNDKAMIVFMGSYRDDVTDRIGVARTGLQQQYYVQAHYPDSTQVSFETRVQAFNALQSGNVSCLIGASSVLQRFLADHPELESGNSALLEEQESFSVAVRRGDSLMADVLNKAIAQIDRSEITSTMVRLSAADAPYSFGVFIRQNALAVTAGSCLFAALLMVAFISWRRRTKRFNHQQALNQRALESALEQARVASEAKSAFLSNMSHDIRTPMNGIIGMASIAEANLDDPEKVKDCLDKIGVSSRHLLSLINDILDMSKIESGDVQLREEPVSLPELMDDMVTLNRPAADAKSQSLEVSVDRLDHPVALGDALRLQQVFTNLTSNAVKYTPEGGHITITLHEEQPDDPAFARYVFRVTDDGIGMSQEYLPHVFETFSRENDVVSNEVRGTGLGMAIVHKTVMRMNGSIDVESELGTGTTFTVSVELRLPSDGTGEAASAATGGSDATAGSDAPAAQDQAQAQAKDQTQAQASKTTRIDFSGMHVLLAEDNDLNAEIAMGVLAPYGLTFERVSDGKEALELFESSEPGHFDCIFMDVQMPVMDGLASARAIRALDRDDARTVPIFAMTANVFEDDKAKARAAGMDEHLAKPLDIRQIVTALERHLR